MKLSAYPAAIASQQHQILALDQQIITLSESVALFASLIDKEIAEGRSETIALDSTLKNEAQRKAVKLERQQKDPDYYEAAIALYRAKHNRDQLAIELELLRNQFGVAKLEARSAMVSDLPSAIATLEAQAAA